LNPDIGVKGQFPRPILVLIFAKHGKSATAAGFICAILKQPNAWDLQLKRPVPTWLQTKEDEL
jgi:hypothetical protein